MDVDFATQSESARTKVDAVEVALRRMIGSGRFGKGERLVQRELAEILNTSSTPVREALKRLEAAGVVSYIPHHGARVAEVDAADIVELYAIRAVLEGLGAERAAARLTAAGLAELEQLAERHDSIGNEGSQEELYGLNYAIHERIYRASGLRRLSGMIDAMWTLFPWDTMWTIPGRAESVAREHARVMTALRAGNGAEAGIAMREHIDSGGRALLSFQQSRMGGGSQPPALSQQARVRKIRTQSRGRS